MDRVSSAKKYDSTNLRSLQYTPLLLNLPIASVTRKCPRKQPPGLYIAALRKAKTAYCSGNHSVTHDAAAVICLCSILRDFMACELLEMLMHRCLASSAIDVSKAHDMLGHDLARSGSQMPKCYW